MAWHVYADDGPVTDGLLPVRPGDALGTIEELVLASLLTDARDDAAPCWWRRWWLASRGWWADAYDETGDRFGSRLWTLTGRLTDAELRRAEQYANEALAWLRRDGLASTVSAVATRAPEFGRIRLEIYIDGVSSVVLGGP